MDTVVSNLVIKATEHQGRVPATVFSIEGDIDAATYTLLEAEVNAAYAAGMRYLLLDFSRVKYISSVGLRTLKYIFDLLRSESPEESDAAISRGLEDGSFKTTHLKLLNPSPLVRRTLTMVGFDTVLDIHYNFNEAINSF